MSVCTGTRVCAKQGVPCMTSLSMVTTSASAFCCSAVITGSMIGDLPPSGKSRGFNNEFYLLPESQTPPPRSRQQLQRTIQAWANADRTEIAPVSGQNAVHSAALGDCCHRPVDESQIEVPESGVKLKCASDVRWERQLIFVAGCRIEDLRDQLAHHSPVGSQEVIHFRKNEAGTMTADAEIRISR